MKFFRFCRFSLDTSFGAAVHHRWSCKVILFALLVIMPFFASPAKAAMGDLINSWVGGGNPISVAVDGSGTVYVADELRHEIQVFSNDGALLLSWGGKGTRDGQFQYPYGVAVDNSGNVYVADSANERIQVFSSTGVFLRKWGSLGAGDGQFRIPYSIAVDGSGNVYVADTFNLRVQVFSNTGVFLRKWGSYGFGDGQFIYPKGIAVDESGNVYVSDAQRVQVFSSTGAFLNKWAVSYLYDSSTHIAIDGNGVVYVGASGMLAGGRVEVYSNTGIALGVWQLGVGRRNNLGIAVGSSGKVFVADLSFNQMLVFEGYNYRSDILPPVTTAMISGTAGNNGWYVQDAEVLLTAVDSESNVKEIHYNLDGVAAIMSGASASFSINTDGEHSVSYYSIDNADNTETANSLTVKIDKTVPAVTASSNPVSNAHGWNNSDVTIAYACSDAISGILSCQSPITVVSEGAGQVLRGTAEDFAGWTAASSFFVNLDKTAPVITASVSSSPNVNGWNNTDVTVTFVCNDTLSGIASCPDPVIVTTDGANQIITGTAVDKAGNSSTAQVTLNIDKTLPTITAAVSPSPNSNGCNSTDVTVTFTCGDTQSGIASCPAPVIVTTEGAGQVISGTATDKAGNSATVAVTVSIDKTAPEAVIRFDAASQDIKLYNSETGAEAGYIVLPSVDHKEDGEFDDDDEDDRDDDGGHHEKHEAHGKELRQYTLQDCGNNTLTLVLQHKQEGNEAKIKVVSMQYNGGVVVTAPKNKMQAETSTGKEGALKEVEQKIEAKELFELSAKYSGKKDETSLAVEAAGQRETKETRTGMALLELLTTSGALSYRY